MICDLAIAVWISKVNLVTERQGGGVRRGGEGRGEGIRGELDGGLMSCLTEKHQ